MSPVFGTLRRLVLTPGLHEVTFAHRGFPGRNAPAARHLEAIPQAVICGFEWAIEVRDQQELEQRLELVEPALRGFAYEGATMALTIRDSVRGHRTRDLLSGPGAPHIFLAYIGIGFAMSHLPRPLWSSVLPDLPTSPYHPTMSWLAVDGYAFDRAYFDTKRWVDNQYQPSPYPWAGCPEYFHRAADQGVGRALWFISGGVVDDVTDLVCRFPAGRQADLWSGVGLAATFAGGADVAGLRRLRAAAGRYAEEVGLGSVLAAKARSWSGHVPHWSEEALDALTGLTLAQAVGLADRTEVPLEPDHPGLVGQEDGTLLPGYEIWRTRIRTALRTDSAATADVAPASEGDRLAAP